MSLMLPGMNPRDVQKAMKRLGIQQEEIDAKEVIIKTENKMLVIKEPHVSKINMMGQQTFQVVGNVIEIDADEKSEISEDDAITVMEQTGCSRQEAIAALKECNGNLAEAIIKLQSA